MMKTKIEAQYSKEGIIRIFDDEESFKSHAIIWFNEEGEPVVAEPFGYYESGRHFYNREVDFFVIDVFE